MDFDRLEQLERQLLDTYDQLLNTCASLGETVHSYDDPDVANARGAALVALRAVVAIHDAATDDDPDAGRPAGATWPTSPDEGVNR